MVQQTPHPLCGMAPMMGLVQSQLMSWPVGLSSVNSALPALNLSSGSGNNFTAVSPEILQALHAEAQHRLGFFYSGVLRYMHSPLPAPATSKHEVMNPEDALKLHYYTSADNEARRRPVIFLLPSLVNRHYILDLRPEASFVNYLNQIGFDAILVEWPSPEISDAAQHSAQYVEMLLEHLQRHWQKLNRPLIAIGYCMGGVLALALAQLFQRVQGLALLATPWDYTHYPLAKLENPEQKMLEQWVEEAPLFSQEALQLLICMANPYRLYLRFSRFAQEQDATRIASFVALEHWANDGVSVSQAVARECLITWPREQTLLQNRWQVGGEGIDPSTLRIPSFLAIPEQDYVVPPEVSLPLAAILPKVTICRPQAGHVGMVAGMKRQQLWEPLGKWLKQFL